ncbi:hypothetical protein SAMN05444161_8394 [Rhizobiales bacterium GAS191]|nr:hypothetical protein SAMN05444161_8394 [Rhizobiales bacterium GAS191]
MYRFGIVVAWLLFATVPASAGSPPKLDINATCRRAIPLLGDSDNSPYQGCMRDEMDALSELSKSWATFKPGAQAVCTQETRIGGAPSYAELLTCLQLDKQAEEASRENQKPMSQSSGLPINSGAAQSQQ